MSKNEQRGIFKRKYQDLNHFKFKVENIFVESLGKESFQKAGNTSTLTYSLFLYFFLSNLTDNLKQKYVWEDLSTIRTVILDIVRKSLQKCFIWSEKLI
jgi:hypothetical protein